MCYQGFLDLYYWRHYWNWTSSSESRDVNLKVNWRSLWCGIQTVFISSQSPDGQFWEQLKPEWSCRQDVKSAICIYATFNRFNWLHSVLGFEEEEYQVIWLLTMPLVHVCPFCVLSVYPRRSGFAGSRAEWVRRGVLSGLVCWLQSPWL